MRRIGGSVAILVAAALMAGCWPIGWTSIGPVGPVDPGPASSPATSPAPDPGWDVQEIVIVQLTAPSGTALTEEQHAAAETVVRGRLAALAAFGAPDVSVRAIPDGRLRIEIPDPDWSDAVRRVATAPGALTLEAIPAEYTGEVMTGGPLPAGLSTEVIVPSGQVAAATPGTDDYGQLIVDLQLDDIGAAAFDAWAVDHVGQRLAVILDGIVLAAPTSNAPRYQGQVQIAGNLDRPAMEELAAVIAGGILSVQAEVLWLCPADDPAPACPSPLPSAS